MDHQIFPPPAEVGSFFMDETEVTNTEYAEFIEEAGYVTVAERDIDWEEMKKYLSRRECLNSRFHPAARLPDF